MNENNFNDLVFFKDETGAIKGLNIFAAWFFLLLGVGIASDVLKVCLNSLKEKE